MTKQARILLLAAAAPALATHAQTTGADVLVVSPLEQSVESPLESAGPNLVAGSDPWIAARVAEAFLSHRSAVAADAEIAVKEGVVHLRGQTVSEEYKALATAYAWEVEGVKGVDNRMVAVGTRVSVKSTAVDRMNDSATTVRVKAALILHRSISACRTKVRTKDGVVTLRGRARDAAEKDLIGKLVSDLDGVSAVDNRMTTAL